MPHAARTYPIVFSAAAPTVPFAVVGLRENENLFVDATGNWRDDAYIPAYVRRYPFCLVETDQSAANGPERLIPEKLHLVVAGDFDKIPE